MSVKTVDHSVKTVDHCEAARLETAQEITEQEEPLRYSEWLRKRRTEKKLTQEQAAILAGMGSKQAWARYENGAKARPLTIKRQALALNVPEDEALKAAGYTGQVLPPVSNNTATLPISPNRPLDADVKTDILLRHVDQAINEKAKSIEQNIVKLVRTLNQPSLKELDEVTNLPKLYAFHEQATRQIKKVREALKNRSSNRSSSRSSFVVFEIRNFENYNWDIGNEVLRIAARTIQHEMPERAMIFRPLTNQLHDTVLARRLDRHFFVLLPNTSLQEAHELAWKVKNKIIETVAEPRHTPDAAEQSTLHPVKIVFGAATVTHTTRESHDLVQDGFAQARAHINGWNSMNSRHNQHSHNDSSLNLQDLSDLNKAEKKLEEGPLVEMPPKK